MKYKFSNAEEAIQMIRSHSFPVCISAFIPLRHISPGQKEDWKSLDKLLIRMLEITEGIPEMKHGAFRDNVSDMFRSIQFNRHDKGLGVYMSGSMMRYMTFPFEVKEDLVLGSSFQIKELYRLQQYAIDYAVIYLSEKRARLFTGTDGSLLEVADGYFPAHYADQHEYEHPSRSSSYAGSAHLKGFEKDRSVMEKIRFEDFIRSIDNHLERYLQPDSALIVCGNKSHAASFLKHSDFSGNVKDVIHGGYDWFDVNEFKELVWPSMKSLIDNRMDAVMEEFKQRSGEGFSEEGMEQVWNAVKEGRVQTLLVEEDYETGGYVEESRLNIFKSSAPSANAMALPHAINELVSLAAEQGGKIVFVDANMLPAGDHVAAICRY